MSAEPAEAVGLLTGGGVVTGLGVWLARSVAARWLKQVEKNEAEAEKARAKLEADRDAKIERLLHTCAVLEAGQISLSDKATSAVGAIDALEKRINGSGDKAGDRFLKLEEKTTRLETILEFKERSK